MTVSLPQPQLTSRRLILRAPNLEDCPLLEEMAGDRRVAEMTESVPHPYPRGGAAAWIRFQRTALAEGAGIAYVITLKSSGKLIGCISLDRIGDNAAELGYWIGRDHWGHGYCPEAARQLTDFGFAALGLSRIRATHLRKNPASGRVLEKAGFMKSGEGEIENWRGQGRTAGVIDYILDIQSMPV